ncbi:MULTISPECIES: zinc ABC transporter substrate-binding protein ZnuA [Brucella/Ochrobactrum group]|jgi:zinc transport system substrate-binding protein|uniref:High-affinity zinc uptake system protein ZnuA n=1 Tax=Brucella pseudintermedia TaxID=370111 RepID=A0ABY5UE65_9HYPH|nr:MULTISPECIES: zinc ABC transporter substrate-binding protein ZnuA [Brucella/Ochrobactrum group]KAB2683103.1 zinc ABC transporter substrate-binding protein ZnuA [Brucella pseudintermedia]NKE74437.1 zinc ABC transporter substrate-binding protein ZnuA [Ochrobactrum sp. MC-1LL]TWH04663.1 zinc transport system substrate-binding protein [Ochrobactrum sp. J50]UWL61613.1 zinc ABC transporter substrate-binding protein ZnuA [Brucella pseudintermedia]WPM82361.1 zinc ABC transporter substrate-binding p
MKHLRSLLLASAFLAGAANISLAAEREGVVVSIKPLHSIVSAVMQGVGEPKLIVQGAGSEHVYSLKPSDAEAIEHAKVIFWAGPSMETFLDKPIDTLGEGAKIVALGDADGLTKLKFREGGPFEAHDHGHEGHDHAAEAPEAGHGHDHGHDHGHSEFDLHFWLDPQNGKVLAADIAKTLAESDPEHAAQYEKNAKDYGEKIDALTAEVANELEPVKDKPFIVFHDAYQYFENRFGVKAAGSITVSPEKAPGAARIKEIHDKIKSLGAACVFSEPQFEPKLVKTVIDGTDAKTGVLDPLGAELKDGPDLYPQLIRNLADSLKTCLSK